MATVQQVYIALFGRPADPFGLEYWEGRTAGAADLSQILAELGNSPEYLNRFDGFTNTQMVNQIYRDLFGRDADFEGLTFFVNLLNTGQANIGDIAVRILDGAQGTDATIVANKTLWADAFTASIDTGIEVVAYNAESIPTVQAWLAAIGVDDTEVDQAAVDAFIAQIVAQFGNPGESLTLTTGVDTLVGTDGDDTFEAPVLQADGTEVTTLQAFDSIDGGAGTDTLNLYATATNNTSLVGSVNNVEIINIFGSDNIDRGPADQAAIDAANAALIIAQANQAAAQDDFDDAQAAYLAAVPAEPAINDAVDGVGPGADNAATLGNVVGAIAGASGNADAEAAATAAANAVTPPIDDPAFQQAYYDALQVTVAAALDTFVENAFNARQDAADDLVAANNAVTVAQANVDAVSGATGAANIDASFFGGSTDITVDGVLTNIGGIEGQNINFSSGGVLSTLSYEDDATTANVSISGESTLFFEGDDLASVTITGSVATANTVILTQIGADTEVTELTLSLSGNFYLDVAGLVDLETIDASGTTGNVGHIGFVDLTGNDALVSYTGGSGADRLTVDLDDEIDRVLDLGAGNDRIEVVGTSLAAGEAGTLTITLGAGNDRVDLEVGLTNITTGTEEGFLDGLISITDFNGGEDVLNVSVLGPLDTLTFDEIAEIQAEDNLYDALVVAQGFTTFGSYSTFVFEGSTYIYNNVGGAGPDALGGDGLIELTGFTGEFTAQNFIA